MTLVRKFSYNWEDQYAVPQMRTCFMGGIFFAFLAHLPHKYAQKYLSSYFLQKNTENLLYLLLVAYHN